MEDLSIQQAGKRTMQYYDQNANEFVQGTISVDFKQTQDRFLSKLTVGAFILDFGCGSGRDAKYFTDFTLETFEEYLRNVPKLQIEEYWITGDVRPGRGEEKWLNLIL